MVTSPFSISNSRAGQGEIHLKLLPPNTPSFQSLNFTYPLKLVCSTPHKLYPSESLNEPEENSTTPANVPLVFMLSYGGGLLPPDSISLLITLEHGSRLTLTTQGSTKIFPSSSTTIPSTAANHPYIPAIASQTLTTTIHNHAALLLAPDPVQPFARSHYTQHQSFTLAPLASLCLLDWITEGRRARGESWQAGSWTGKNEIWREFPSSGCSAEKKTLMLRDAILLDNGPQGPGQSSLQRENIGVFGTIILAGPLFERLGEFFVREFAAMPRIGGRRWGDEDDDAVDGLSEEEAKRLHSWRAKRMVQESQDRVLWTMAKVRGSVVVKFSAAELEGGKRWIESIWRWEGTIGREFGEGGFMCLR